MSENGDVLVPGRFDRSPTLGALGAAMARAQAKFDRILKDKDATIRDAAVAVMGLDDGVYLKQAGRRLYIPGLKQPMTYKLLAQGKVLGDANARQGGRDGIELAANLGRRAGLRCRRPLASRLGSSVGAPRPAGWAPRRGPAAGWPR